MAIEQSTSVTATMVPIITALVKAEDILGTNRNWRYANPTQTLFLDKYFSQRDQIEKALADTSSIKPLKVDGIASYNAQAINAFLAKKGFNIALEPFTRPGEFGTASVADVLVKWLHAGTSTQLKAIDNQTYPAARLKRGVTLARSFVSDNPVAYISTQHLDYTVGLTIPSTPVTDAFELLDFVGRIKNNVLSPDRRYEGLIFPKVNLDQRVNIDWIKGITTTGKDGVLAVISQALQQTKYRMNEFGARSESGVAFAVSRGGGIPPRIDPLVIDRPFVCWMEKTGISFPLFAGYINYPDWRDPGSLE